ncbi:MAG TPA: hypothetical protein VFY40_09720 [Blastocatellia bacterium]|nr:hypothetical protein [Blastocatellia bacterium]
MPKLNSPLDNLKVAAPCSADWDQMFSFQDERVRFCSQCNLNVYNLSGMSRREAADLITKTEGRLCVRFYRRADGSVLTQNCPVGLKKIKRRLVWAAQVVVGMAMGIVSGFGLYIYHLGIGRRPNPLYELINNRFGSEPLMGTLVAEPISEKIPPAPPVVGQARIRHGQNSRGEQGQVKK